MKPAGYKPTRPGRQTRPRQGLAKAAVYRPSDRARVVSAIEAGIDLGHYLSDCLPGQWSVRAIRRLLAQGAVTVNGQLETFGSRRLRKGDVVDTVIPEASKEQEIDRFEAHRVAFDAQGIFVYNKPPGIAVTPTEDGKQWHLLKMLNDAVGPLFPTHRLDADTSGLVVWARSEALAEQVSEWFREHRVRKTYHAIVRGHPRPQGERRSYLVIKEQQAGFEKWGTGRGPGAREAITRWTVEEQVGPYASLLRVEPATGRHHQIRIHCAEIGHPLYGDRIYGDRRDPVLCRRHMLHASRIYLPSPDGDRGIHVKCQLPADMRELMQQLRKR